MTPTLVKNWWLLAVCAILDAIIAGLYLAMYDSGPDGLLTFKWVVGIQSRLAMAAGVCTIAAGIGRPAQSKSWLLVLNGLALGAYGMIPLLWKGPLSFNVFALLLVVMAVSAAMLAWSIARAVPRHVAADWFFGLAGATSAGFALAFLALVNRWIQLERRPFHPALFLWLCAYFGFSAICMLGLAWRQRGLGASLSSSAYSWSPAA